MKKWNHYTCNKCGKITIARHDDVGVTPFMLACYAQKGCTGTATSHFFMCDQSDKQKPHIIFYRPSEIQALEDINKEPKRNRAWLLDHYQKGGALTKIA